ncbi:hypothetical protein Tco_0041052 [Tanacetum coccineum]
MRYSLAMTILNLFWVNVIQRRGFHGLETYLTDAVACRFCLTFCLQRKIGFVEPHLGWLSVVAGVFTLNQLNTGQVDELQNTIEEDQKSMMEEMRMAIYENKSIVEDAAGSSEAMAID